MLLRGWGRNYMNRSTKLGKMLSHLTLRGSCTFNFIASSAWLMKYKLRSHIFKFLLNYSKIKELELIPLLETMTLLGWPPPMPIHTEPQSRGTLSTALLISSAGNCYAHMERLGSTEAEYLFPSHLPSYPQKSIFTLKPTL